MREMEFLKLCPGDIVYDSGEPKQFWTIARFQPRYGTFLLVRGRCELTGWFTRLFWFVMAILPERNCLEIADSLDMRVVRIVNPANWAKEEKTES